MEILHERKKERQEKEYHTMLKDIAEENDFKFKNLDVDRKQHYQKVQDKYAKLDKMGYVAFKDHIVEVEAL